MFGAVPVPSIGYWPSKRIGDLFKTDRSLYVYFLIREKTISPTLICYEQKQTLVMMELMVSAESHFCLPGQLEINSLLSDLLAITDCCCMVSFFSALHTGALKMRSYSGCGAA
jgi:hypothetical protein